MATIYFRRATAVATLGPPVRSVSGAGEGFVTNGNGWAWQVLYDLPSWQVTQISRRPHARPGSSPGQDQADRGAAQRLQALVSAFHYGAPIVLGWLREQAGGPVLVLVGGPAL